MTQESERKELLLYTPDAEMDESAIDWLRDAGYVPIKVNSLDAIKVLDARISTARLDAIAATALSTIGDYGGNVSRDFGQRLARKLVELIAQS